MKSRVAQIAKWMNSLAVLVMATGATATGVCAAMCELGACCPPQSDASHQCCPGTDDVFAASKQSNCCELTGAVEAAKSDGLLATDDSPGLGPQGYDYSWLRPTSLCQPQQVAESQVLDSVILDESHTPRGPPVFDN